MDFDNFHASHTEHKARNISVNVTTVNQSSGGVHKWTYPGKTLSAVAAATSTKSSQRPLISSVCPDRFRATNASGIGFSSLLLSWGDRWAVLTLESYLTLLITTQLSCLEKKLFWVTELAEYVLFYLSGQCSATDGGASPIFFLTLWTTLLQ